jgi:hypothetical protein
VQRRAALRVSEVQVRAHIQQHQHRLPTQRVTVSPHKHVREHPENIDPDSATARSLARSGGLEQTAAIQVESECT